jgi:hypothetical protein
VQLIVLFVLIITILLLIIISLLLIILRLLLIILRLLLIILRLLLLLACSKQIYGSIPSTEVSVLDPRRRFIVGGNMWLSLIKRRSSSAGI